MKSCTRCGGQMLLDLDEDFRFFLSCLQCGMVIELPRPLRKVLPGTYERRDYQKSMELLERNNLIRQLASEGQQVEELRRKFKLGTDYIKQIINEQTHSDRKGARA